MKRFKVFSLILLMGFVPMSHAFEAIVTGAVQRTLVADQGRWGGCMMVIDKTLTDYGLDCPSQWLSFSCSGVFAAKDVAYRMFDSAQMAYALGKDVLVTVDDTKKHNGYCYANRIDVLP